ncbi:hypothetical protein [Amycolatopsis jiangsuensis]|uniref:Molecular chaperone DnaK n=1 Tax=Amycolatopsis jiangsuensis TaxID=1181879 RepID=A0A840IX30_9PSEU|nr:hypothetical protein [Amycolatopsis jiangsuensis]MBB4685708.1 hypothetical protein [Amycolatopsis jiangsuensis]
MPHVLGIDVGPARTHAATRHGNGERWADPEPLWLGDTGPAAATALFLDDEGYLLTGDAAAGAGAGEPSRLITGFHRRIGDDVPMFVGGEPFTPESLTTVVVEGVADLANDGTSPAPQHLVVTHPGDWGGYRRELLRQALADAGFRAATLVPSAVAALYAHLPHPGPDDRTAAVCEFGPDGVTITLATSSGAGGWISRTSTEGVAPAAAVSNAFALAHAAAVTPEALAGIVFCGEPGPGTLPSRLPCPVFADPHPALTAATGAAVLASQRTGALPSQRPGIPRHPDATRAPAAPRETDDALLQDPDARTPHRPDAHGPGAHDTDTQGRNAQGRNAHGADTHGPDARGRNTQGRDTHRGADTPGRNTQGRNAHGADTHDRDTQGRNAPGADVHGPDPRGRNAQGADVERRDAHGADARTRRSPDAVAEPGGALAPSDQRSGALTRSERRTGTCAASRTGSRARQPHGRDPRRHDVLDQSVRPGAETVLLPRVDELADLPERPERPPVEITPFELPEPEGVAKLFRRWRPLAAAAAVLAIAASVLIATLSSHPATADRNPVPPPAPSSCSRPATAPSGEGHC